MSEQYYNTIVSTLILCVMCRAYVYGDFNWSLNLLYDPSLLELGIILHIGFYIYLFKFCIEYTIDFRPTHHNNNNKEQ